MSRLKTILLSLRGLALVNIFFLLPLSLALVSNVPRIAEATVKTSAPSSLKIGLESGSKISYERVKDFMPGVGPQRVVVNLPCDFPMERFVASLGGAELLDITVRRNFVLKGCYQTTLADGTYRCERKGFYSIDLTRRGCMAICAVEFLLWLVALIFSIFCKSREDGKRFVFSISTAALVSAFFTMVVPLQSFLANRALFEFPASDFAKEVVVAWAVLFIVLAVGLHLSRRPFGYFIHSVLIGFVVYEYLQCGVLAIGEPEINGEVFYYTNKSLAVRDTAVLCSIMVVFICGYRWLKPYLNWIVIGLFVMIAASLLDIKRDSHCDVVSSPLSQGFCSKLDVAQSTVHSGRRNVMMIILDSIGTEVSLDALAECPDLKEAFTGFVAFTNNIGVHDFTEPSVPAIMTGKLFDRGVDDDTSFHDYGFSALGEGSFLADYTAAGIPTSFLPGSFMFGYSSTIASAKANDDKGPISGSVFDFRPDTTPPFTLFETARFRLMPFAAKYKTLLMTFVGTRSHSGVKNESALYPILAAAPVDMNLANNLEIFHTDGAHSPFNVDRDGNQTSVSREDWSGHLDKTIWVFKNLANLFDAYHRLGIYDNSFIVVTADHGWMSKIHKQDLDSLHVRAPTLLWVKPIGSNSVFSFSDEPTWHLNLKSLMLSAMENDLSVPEVKAILHSDDRIFRQIKRHGCEEWHVDADGNAKKK